MWANTWTALIGLALVVVYQALSGAVLIGLRSLASGAKGDGSLLVTRALVNAKLIADLVAAAWLASAALRYPWGSGG